MQGTGMPMAGANQSSSGSWKQNWDPIGRFWNCQTSVKLVFLLGVKSLKPTIAQCQLLKSKAFTQKIMPSILCQSCKKSLVSQAFIPTWQLFNRFRLRLQWPQNIWAQVEICCERKETNALFPATAATRLSWNKTFQGKNRSWVGESLTSLWEKRNLQNIWFYFKSSMKFWMKLEFLYFRNSLIKGSFGCHLGWLICHLDWLTKQLVTQKMSSPEIVRISI